MTTSAPARPVPAAHHGHRARGGGLFTGTRTLTRLALRRDRILAPVWIAVFAVMAYFSAAATIDLYPDVASRRGLAQGINATASTVALYGPIYDETSIGEIALFKFGAFGAALVGILGIILTVRHTRAEEEAGRIEMLGAGVLGRLAPLGSALTLVTGVNVVLAVVTAGCLVGAGLPAAGSIAFGLAWAVSGIAYAGVAAVAAQLMTSARAATGLAVSVLGATYVLRAIGDTAPEGGARWLSWLSPVGWSQQVRPFAGQRWWLLALSAAFAALTVWAACLLSGRRDLGAGVLPDRAGRARAGRWLGTPEGLALRLHRGMLLTWTAGYVLLSFVLGGIVANLSTSLSSPGAEDFIRKLGGEQGMTDAFIATELSFIGVFTSAFAVQAMLRLRGEEAAHHADPLLSTSTSRLRWAGSHLLVAVGGSLWLLLVVGLTCGLSVSSALGEPRYFGELLQGAFAQVPAVLVLVGIVVLAIGVAPRAASLGWAALVAFLLLGELGPLLQLDQWLLDVSPYTHVPKLPGGTLTATPLIGLTAVAVALIVAGLTAFGRRDLE
jgi:ABC-2 type transport system permease protein